MNAEFKAKFLQSLCTKNPNQGFTLIELLIVFVIVGILSAIALPSFLNQANKARQSEAKTYVGAVNRMQQAYFVEYGQFGTAAQIEGGINYNTQNYTYTIATKNLRATIKADAQKQGLKSYSGMAEVQNAQTYAIVCETKTASFKAVLPKTAFQCFPSTLPVGQ